MISEERRQRLLDLYVLATANKIVTSKGEFADYCGIARPTMSSAMNGSNEKLTDKLVARVEYSLRDLIAKSEAEKAAAIAAEEEQSAGAELMAAETSNDSVEVSRIWAGQFAEQRQSYERIIMAILGQKPAEKDAERTQEEEALRNALQIK